MVVWLAYPGLVNIRHVPLKSQLVEKGALMPPFSRGMPQLHFSPTESTLGRKCMCAGAHNGYYLGDNGDSC